MSPQIERLHSVASFVAFAHGRVVSDDAHAPGIEIGKPSETYRRIRIESTFGKLTVLRDGRPSSLSLRAGSHGI